MVSSSVRAPVLCERNRDESAARTATTIASPTPATHGRPPRHSRAPRVARAGGPIGKALAERGIDPKTIKVLGMGELTEDEARKNMGDASLGIITVYHYDHTHDSALNKAFVKTFSTEYGGRNPNIYSVGGYDGMHLIYEVLKKTGGKTDAAGLVDAAKGMAWESPRAPS
jgi:ABC-type branched-subunit amino acid transport system substrate-binding protein